ncbi:MAG: hypothetical protein H7Z75_14945, partial [Ferruginibacter sp.]|nr:hypothetical protein [Cytophagales bacterium]
VLALIGFRLSLPKSLYRAFALAEVGPVINIPNEIPKEAVVCNVLGGGYFGKRRLQPYLLGGVAFNVSKGSGGLLLGGGLSYKKKIHLEIRNGFFYLVRFNF